MLQIAENREIARPSIPHQLGYALHDLGHLPPSKTRLALLAYWLCARHGLSQREAAQLVGVSLTYVGAVSRLSPEQRAQLITGDLTLSSVVNGHRRNGDCSLAELLKAVSAGESTAITQPKAPPTDEEVDHLIAAIGAERVMASLDRYTQPRLFAAE
jgi:hypothetical protein